jgi:AcrR family transcriptional regulator
MPATLDETQISHQESALLCPATPVSKPAPKPALQQRVAAAILDAAADVLVVQGPAASMSDVAAAAGVARATLYRYFPSRDALLGELAELAVEDVGARLAAARLEEVHPEEGVRRSVRALVEVGNAFVVIARDRLRPPGKRFERALLAPLRALVARGQSSGELRDDVPAAWLAETLVALVVTVLSSPPVLGREDTIALTTSVFLDGSRGRKI